MVCRKRRGDVGLAGARTADEDHVVGVFNELTPVKLAHQGFINFAGGKIKTAQILVDREARRLELYRAALGVLTLDKMPATHAATQNQLGHTLANLAERERSTTHMEAAVAAHRAAVETPPLTGSMRASNANYRFALAKAQAKLAIWENSATPMQEAISFMRSALETDNQQQVARVQQRITEMEAELTRLLQ